MRVAGPAKLLRIHCSESDRCDGKPLYEVIVDRCREARIAGVTVFSGLEGYGETADMHRAHLLRHDQPVVLTIVDTAENIERLITAIEPLIPTGVTALSDVEAIRIEKDRSL